MLLSICLTISLCNLMPAAVFISFLFLFINKPQYKFMHENIFFQWYVSYDELSKEEAPGYQAFNLILFTLKEIIY